MSVPADWSASFTNNPYTKCAISVQSDVRAICPNCRRPSTFSVRAQCFAPYNVGPDRRTEVHLILECLSAVCTKRAYVKTSIRCNETYLDVNDDFFIYPFSAIDVAHASIPLSVAEDWKEAQTVMQASAPKAAAVMLRRVLYGVLIDKGCNTRPLDKAVEDLIQKERLPAMFDAWLPAISLDGMDAAHPDRALNVSTKNVIETMEYTKELLRYLYIEPFDFEKRKARNAIASQVAVSPTPK